MTRTADVVIVGAGGTGRSVGIIRQLYPTRETTEMVVHSLAVYPVFDSVLRREPPGRDLRRVLSALSA